MDCSRKSCSKLTTLQRSCRLVSIADACGGGNSRSESDDFVSVCVVFGLGDTALRLSLLQRGDHLVLNERDTFRGKGNLRVHNEQVVDTLLHIILEPITEADNVDPLTGYRSAIQCDVLASTVDVAVQVEFFEGVDLGLRDMIKPDMKPVELRWVQTQVDANGVSKEVGCKAFLRCIPTKIPGVSLAVGETSEGECTFTVTRYNLFIDGQRMLLIDRLAGIVNIGGTNYVSKLNSML